VRSRELVSTPPLGVAEKIPVVNAHNEWSKLEEVIVGTPFHLDYQNDESFRLFFHLNLMKDKNWSVFRGSKPPSNRVRDESLEDLDEFVKILTARGVIVRRPQMLTEVRTVRTPFWEAPLAHAMMSRDLFIIIGDELIETAPMVRSRYFEGDLYKELFTEYFKRGARWTVAPKSRLMDENFDYTFVLKHGYADPVPEIHAYEIMFDGAQILRCGDHLFFNCSTDNHRMGAQWLQRHLGSRYKVVVFELTDNHIDGLILPLKPGWLLVEEQVALDSLPEELRKWNVIRYEPYEETTAEASDDLPLLASQSIGMNVLSLDEDHVVVQDMQHKLIRDLEHAGFTPIPCRWRHGRTLGGGFHCLTLDIRRQSRLESYF